MSTYNESLLNRTPEEQQQLELKRQLRAAKKRARVAKEIADTKYKISRENDRIAASELLARNGYGHLAISKNAAPSYNRGRYDYEMVKYDGKKVAVPVTPVRRNVPEAAVRATGAAMPRDAIVRDRKSMSSVRYDPRSVSAQHYHKWAMNPGSADMVGIDCRANAKPTRSRNAKSGDAPVQRTGELRTVPANNVRVPVSRTGVEVVRAPGVKPFMVPVNPDGTVPVEYLRSVSAARRNSARAYDDNHTSKKVLPQRGNIYQQMPWLTDPGSCDIRGVDAPDNAKVTYRRPLSPEEAKRIQARKNKVNGRKGGLATAAKKKAAAASKPKAEKKAKFKTANAPAKKSETKTSNPVEKTAPKKTLKRDAQGRFTGGTKDAKQTKTSGKKTVKKAQGKNSTAKKPNQTTTNRKK